MFEFQFVRTKICGAIKSQKRIPTLLCGGFAYFSRHLLTNKPYSLFNFRITCPCSYYWMNTSFLVKLSAVSVDYRLCQQFCQKSMIPLLAKRRISFGKWYLYQAVPIFPTTNFVSFFVFIALLHKNDSDTRSNKMRFCQDLQFYEAQWKLLFLFAVIVLFAFWNASMIPSLLFFWRRDLCLNLPYKAVYVGDMYFFLGRGGRRFTSVLFKSLVHGYCVFGYHE